MRKGDIVLFKYNKCLISKFIRKITRCEYNHCGIVIDSHYVLEKRAYGWTIKQIKDLKQKYELKLIRLNKLSEEKTKKAVDWLIQKHKIQKINILFKILNYIKWFISIVNLGIKGRKATTVGLTCSGALGRAFSHVGFYFRKDCEPTNIYPSDLLKADIKGINHQI